MFCPKCQTEYREGFTECADCHVALVEQLPDQHDAADHDIPDDVRLVHILETDNLADVASIKLLLDSEGIEYALQGDIMKFVRPVDRVSLVVRKDDADRVRELLKTIKLNYSSNNFIPKRQR